MQFLNGYMDAMEAMSDQINGYTFKDTMIQDIVVKEMEYFLTAANRLIRYARFYKIKLSFI